MAFKVLVDNGTDYQPGQHMPLENAIAQAGVFDLSRTDYAVTQNGTPNLSVNVAKGEAFVENSSWVYGTGDVKYWPVWSSATENVAISANSSGNPRIDIICVKVDSTAAGTQGSLAGSVVAIAGTPASVPVVPSTPANHYKLAEVAVANGATTITNANITDRRTNAGINVNGTILSDALNINSTTLIDGVLDEDTMSSNSATKAATQQSIKAYVDNNVINLTTQAGVDIQKNIVSGTAVTTLSGTSLDFNVAISSVFPNGTSVIGIVQVVDPSASRQTVTCSVKGGVFVVSGGNVTFNFSRYDGATMSGSVRINFILTSLS